MVDDVASAKNLSSSKKPISSPAVRSRVFAVAPVKFDDEEDDGGDDIDVDDVDEEVDADVDGDVMGAEGNDGDGENEAIVSRAASSSQSTEPRKVGKNPNSPEKKGCVMNGVDGVMYVLLREQQKRRSASIQLTKTRTVSTHILSYRFQCIDF